MNVALIVSAIFLLLFLATAIATISLSISLRRRELEVRKEKEVSARQLYELLILKELSDRAGYSLDLEEILEIITNSLRQFLDYTAVGFVVLSGDKVKLNVHFDKPTTHNFFLQMKERMLASLRALGHNVAQTNITESVSGAIEVESGAGIIGSFFNIPLVVGGRLGGVLTIANEKRGLYKEEDMTILYRIIAQASRALDALQKVVTREQERVNRVREEYTSIIVHELRSPLDGIRKISELVLSGKIKGPEIKEYVAMAYQSSNRMMELVNDMLDMSKIQAGKFEINKSEQDLREIIEGRVMFYKVSTDMAKIDLKVYVDKSVPAKISMDKEAVKQMLGNLLSNALKFTNPGGKILISAFLARPDKPFPEGVAALKMPILPKEKDVNVSTSSVCVVVSDDGFGVAPELLPNLFKMYSQVKSKEQSEGVKGTGLGLSIVKGLSEVHGGKSGVVSKDGLGSSFFFTLPV